MLHSSTLSSGTIVKLLFCARDLSLKQYVGQINFVTEYDTIRAEAVFSLEKFMNHIYISIR